jgi:ankyrin repeat protein
VKLLIGNHCDVNTSNSDGDTALILAAEKGHLECVKLLIDNHCDVNARTKYGIIALILASLKAIRSV